MPTILDAPPTKVQHDIEQLRGYLERHVPPKRPDKNLLIATWNLRAFASLTRKWTAVQKDRPKRDLRGLLTIAEIIKRFDVVAIQEVQGNLRALRDLLKWLGEDWSFLMTDITLGSSGNSERIAFVFNRSRVQVSGLASELVVPPEWLTEIGEHALTRQFARTPYAVSFKAGNTTFILVTLHVNYGKDAKGRIPELKAIARWMREWAARSSKWSHNLIALGDFNIDRRGDPLWQAFTSTGLTVPEGLTNIPRTVFANKNKPQTEKYFDQIAWFETSKGVKKLSLEYVRSGYVDFLPYVYQDTNLNKRSISYRVSDHYPLWTEFLLR